MQVSMEAMVITGTRASVGIRAIMEATDRILVTTATIQAAMVIKSVVPCGIIRRTWTTTLRPFDGMDSTFMSSQGTTMCIARATTTANGCSLGGVGLLMSCQN